KFNMPEYLVIQAGYGTIRVFTAASLEDGTTGMHQLYYKNNYAPTGSAYQINAFVDRDVAVTLGKQNRDEIQQSMTMNYEISHTLENLSVNPGAVTATTEVPNQAQKLLDYPYESGFSPWT